MTQILHSLSVSLFLALSAVGQSLGHLSGVDAVGGGGLLDPHAGGVHRAVASFKGPPVWGEGRSGGEMGRLKRIVNAANSFKLSSI